MFNAELHPAPLAVGGCHISLARGKCDRIVEESRCRFVEGVRLYDAMLAGVASCYSRQSSHLNLALALTFPVQLGY